MAGIIFAKEIQTKAKTNAGKAPFKQGDKVYLISINHTGKIFGGVDEYHGMIGMQFTIRSTGYSYWDNRPYLRLKEDLLDSSWSPYDFSYTLPEGMKKLKKPELPPWQEHFNTQLRSYTECWKTRFMLHNHRAKSWKELVTNRSTLVNYHSDAWTMFSTKADKDGVHVWDEGSDGSRRAYDHKLLLNRWGDLRNPTAMNTNTACWAGALSNMLGWKHVMGEIPKYMTIQIPLRPAESYYDTKDQGYKDCDWREMKLYIEELAAHKLLPLYLLGQHMFKHCDPNKANDKQPKYVYARLNLRSLTRERFFWYASCIRNTGEHQSVIPAFAHLTKLYPTSHVLTRYILAHATNPKYQGGHSNLDLSECRTYMPWKICHYDQLLPHTLRIWKFLTTTTTNYKLTSLKCKKMWLLNDHLRGGKIKYNADGTTGVEYRTRTGHPMPVRVKYKADREINWKAYLSFNPETRTFEEDVL
jgi:hypothetical protein